MLTVCIGGVDVDCGLALSSPAVCLSGEILEIKSVAMSL